MKINHSPLRFIIVLFCSAVFSNGCVFDGNSSLTSPSTETPAASNLPNWYSIYFMNPDDPSARSYRNGPDADLVAAIENARDSIDIAIYDFSLWNMRDALIDAHARGVAVRMVTESDNMDEPEIDELRQAGIEVLGDRHESAMHNKFMVIDHYEVWTGSTNYNINSFYQNDNNIIRIRSSRLAEDYIVEFEEMFVDDRFGANSPANTPYPVLTIGGSRVEVYFSPDDGGLARLLEVVGGAQKNIYFLAYSFTSDQLAGAMTSHGQAGVVIKGVFEKDQYISNTGTEYDNLRNAGFDIRLDANPKHMHHKIIIIDESIVVTGSYNFSANAEKRNDENFLILFDADIAAQYLEEFWRIFDKATD